MIDGHILSRALSRSFGVGIAIAIAYFFLHTTLLFGICSGARLMHIHILGICGTFMAGVAALARASGFRVTGSDRGVYPPMSDQLAELGIEVSPGYGPEQLEPGTGCSSGW